MKLFVSRNNQSKNKKQKINYWIRILGISTFLALFPCNEAFSSYPSLLPQTARLNVSFPQCKAKANEIANLVFNKVSRDADTNNLFRLFGTTSKTTSVLMCIKSVQGTYFILATSGDSFADTQNEYKSVYNRINSYMLEN